MVVSNARARYSMKDHGQGTTENYGNMILRPGIGNIRRPSWDKTETVLRILPCLSHDRSNWEPYRYSLAARDFGDWIRVYPAVRSFGENGGVTFLLADTALDPNYDVHRNPCVILRDAVQKAIKNKQERPGWASLIQGSSNRAAPLGRHSDVYICRAAIFRLKDEDKATAEKAPLGLGNNDLPMFLEMSDSAGRALIDLLEVRNDNYQVPTDGDIDFDQAYECGDVVSLDKGGFVHFYQDGYDPRQKQAQQQASSGPRTIAVGSNRGGSRQNEPAKRFCCFVDKVWNNYSANLDDPALEDMIRRKDRPWEDCLSFMDHATQARVLQERDTFPADLFLYAWQDHKEWIIQRTKDRAVSSTTVSMDPANDERPSNPLPTRNRNPVNPPAARPQQQSASKAGGWGNSSWDEATTENDGATDSKAKKVDESAPKVDDVQPQAVSAPAESNVDEATSALKAMEEARRRAKAAAAKARM